MSNHLFSETQHLPELSALYQIVVKKEEGWQSSFKLYSGMSLTQKII